jgi:hypothetical protein
MYPLFAALALAWPQLLLAMPTFFTITRARRAMEAWGTTAYLWHALSRPAKVTWPIATPLARSYRAWRTDRARRLAQQKEQDQQQEKAWKEAVAEEKLNPTETAAPAGDEPGTEDGSQLQRTRKLHALPEETGDQDNEPTALIPKPEPVETEDTASPASGPRGTVNRAARHLLDQGGALGLNVRNRRRGHANRRPPSHKP